MKSSAASLRQSMAGLHTWLGLVCGWGVFVVFFTGTLCVFENAITHWMKRERSTAVVATTAAERAQALSFGQRHMAGLDDNTERWTLQLPAQHGAPALLTWQTDSGRHLLRLDAQDGQPSAPPPVIQTVGAHLFVSLHKQLHGGHIGMWAVGFFGIAMLVALISGIIIHKRLFQDFFTFRPRKGARSWLDAHNATAVLSLPFLLVMSYTGLAIYYSRYMPAGIVTYFPDQPAYFQALYQLPPPPLKTLSPGQPLALATLLSRAESHLGQHVAQVSVTLRDGGVQAVFSGPVDDAYAHRRMQQWSSATISFDAVSGKQIDAQAAAPPVKGGAPMNVQRIMGTLHMVRFGDTTIAWLFFLSGLVGCAMIACGLLLFMVKRRKKSLGEFGRYTVTVYRVIDILNITLLAGVIQASLVLLWANRLLPITLPHRTSWEVTSFFLAWGAALLHACWRRQDQAWREQIAFMALLCLLLPLASTFGTQDQLVTQLLRRDWHNAAVELTVLALGMLCLRTLGWLRRSK